VDPHPSGEKPRASTTSLWPAGFAVGIAVLLVGLVISWILVAIGAGIAVFFGFLWAVGATRSGGMPESAQPGEVAEAPSQAVVAGAPAAAEAPPAGEGEGEQYTRNVFLEASTLGVGAIIGGVVTLPVLGFAVLPAFLGQKHHHVDIGPISNFPEGQFVVTTFMRDPAQGEVSRRTAYVRNNGLLRELPSFTIISNSCAHLGCPVQPNGPLFTDKEKHTTLDGQQITTIPTQPAGFGCPCHGGQYDTEGNRVAGPPVRALDRYEYAVMDGHIVLGKTYSVAKVTGEGANAKIEKYKQHGPGQHVNGPEAWFYPLEPPQ
jgi:Rieske Fe-S protein